jgi:hypothetical protein
MVDINSAASQTLTKVTENANSLINNPSALIIGIILIIGAIIFVVVLKNILLNSIIGIAGFLICNFIFGIKLPLIATLIVSAIFGTAGLGAILILKFIGII